MKFSAVICAFFAGSAAAFAPSIGERSSTSLNMVDRRAAFGQIAGAGAAAALVALPQIASADGAVSAATISRARGLYGDRIFALKSAVDNGDFAAVADEKNAFILFNSGAYANDKSKKTAAVKGTNDIFSAIRSQDKAALKKAYSSYVAANGIKPIPEVNVQTGQGYSGDYDYRVRTKAAAVYVR